ncbi:hypothetical protein LCGC14_2317560, partial [marine sediment metagenome]
MKKRIVIYIMLLSGLAVAAPIRDVFPESEIKRFRSLTDFQLDAGTGQGQVLYWDGSNNKWIPSETPPASDEIVFWDNGDSAIKFLTVGAGLTISGTEITSSLFTHAILSTGHTDATTGTVARGDLVIGQGASSTWTRKALGASATILRSDGTDATWTATTSITTLGTLTDLTVAGDLTVDTDTLHVDSTGHKVGIGTTSPDKSLEIRNSSPVIRLRDTGATANATTAFIEFGGTDAGVWNRTGYIGDGQSGNTDIILQAEDSDLILGDSSGFNILTLSGGDATFTGSINIGASGKINFRDTDISIGSTLTDGILDITADFSIDMFFDNADVGAEVDGQSLNINRRAVEGDDYISLYVDKDKKGLIGFSGDNDL